MNIIIDPGFKSLIPPLSKEEYTQLEANVIAEGCRDALVTWGETLIDGHNRLEICQKHGIPFNTAEMEFESREDAKEWIIDNQFGRRNLSAYDRALLALKKKEIIAKKAKEKQKEHGRTAPGKTLSQKSDEVNTKKELAKIAGVSHDTIHKVEVIERKAPEEIKQKLKDSELSINQAYEAVKGKTPAQLVVSSESNEWYTPAEYIEAAREVLGEIDVDPATCEQANRTVKAKAWYTSETNGLLHDWPGRVWMNPPYGGLTEKFVAKLLEQHRQGVTTEAVLLVNSHATDTKWFQPLWDHMLCFTNHRINFVPSEGKNAIGSTHGSVFIYLGTNQEKFASVFNKVGAIVRRYAP